MHDPDEKLTDLQYALMCGLTAERLAARTRTTPTRIREELTTTRMPAWATPLAAQVRGR